VIPPGGFRNPYGYRGEYTDNETEFVYLRARYYDPKTARFTQEDTWLDQGPNLYSYCDNDPVNRVDPSGHCHGMYCGSGECTFFGEMYWFYEDYRLKTISQTVFGEDFRKVYNKKIEQKSELDNETAGNKMHYISGRNFSRISLHSFEVYPHKTEPSASIASLRLR